MSKTIEMARVAVETGTWLLYECDHDVLTLNGITKRILEGKKEASPIENWLRPQGRFRHLRSEDVHEIKKELHARWKFYKTLMGIKK
jgi:pyruvate ferredoxin oxidoreductase beta subunit